MIDIRDGRLQRPPAYADVDGGVANDENWRLHPMSHVRRFDHVGITVADLDSATAFFVGLGLEIEGRMFLQGEFVDTVIGIPDSLSEIVMLRPPTEALAWSCRASSGPTMSQGRPRRCPPN